MQIDQLDEGQKEALDFIICHLMNKQFKTQHAILNGPAGHGKTATVKVFLSLLNKMPLVKYSVVAFTGRAASQLKSDGINATTIHSLLYKPVMDSNGNLIKFEKKPTREIEESAGDFIIVDEGSTVNSELHYDLTSIGVPILYAGDLSQLPPVDMKVEGFNVMESFPDWPVCSLTVNHRQTEGSGIRKLCEALREDNSIPRIKSSDLSMIPKSSVMKIPFHQKNEFDIIVCGTNKTRKKINKMVREARGFHEELPEVGEQVVCLQNSITGNGLRINNGELFEVTGVVMGDWKSKFFLKSIDTGISVAVDISNECWDTERSQRIDYQTNTAMYTFGYGYALSCHKTQGSQFKKVLFVDENVSFFLDQQKFRYTAVSRASEHLTVAI